MSVAFRRESDEEHKEPRFELPLPAGPNLVTARGMALTHDRLAGIEAAIAGEPDPLLLEDLKRQLRYWQTRATTAQLAPAPSGEEVAFGCRVTLKLNGALRTIDIVGDDEADPKADRVAFSAPLVRAMMNAEVGEMLDFGGKVDAIEIMDIAVPGD